MNLMKIPVLYASIKKSLLGVLSVMMIITLTSCERKISFLTSQLVPAARGYAEVKKDKNNNYRIHVELTNLAEVSRLDPPKQTYVVWVLTDQNETKNIGRLVSSSGTFSKQLKATLDSVSSVKPIKIFITAEDDANVQFPGNEDVLTTNNF